jgi:MFS family permease
VGLIAIGFAMQPWLLYVGLAFLALGSGLVNPATTGLISLYATAAEQGRVLGIFRSLGSLSRAITPVLAGTVFWIFGARALFLSAAGLSALAFALSVRLPKPVK